MSISNNPPEVVLELTADEAKLQEEMIRLRHEIIETKNMVKK